MILSSLDYIIGTPLESRLTSSNGIHSYKIFGLETSKTSFEGFEITGLGLLDKLY